MVVVIVVAVIAVVVILVIMVVLVVISGGCDRGGRHSGDSGGCAKVVKVTVVVVKR